MSFVKLYKSLIFPVLFALVEKTDTRGLVLVFNAIFLTKLNIIYQFLLHKKTIFLKIFLEKLLRIQTKKSNE